MAGGGAFRDQTKLRGEAPKTTDSGAGQDGDLALVRSRRGPTAPQASPVHPQISPPGVSSYPRPDYRPAPPRGEVRPQSHPGWHPSDRETPSPLQAKTAASPDRQRPPWQQLWQVPRRDRRGATHRQPVPPSARGRQPKPLS